MNNKINLTDFNTAEGINKYIVGLTTLHEVIDARRSYFNKTKTRLNEFVWRGKLLFDQFGQIFTIYDEQYCRDDSYEVKTKTVTREVFQQYCRRFTTSFKRLPNPDDTCFQCEEEWSLKNVTDYLNGYHTQCYKLYNNERELIGYKKLFAQVYDINDLHFKAIPNQYCDCDQCASWFIVSTPDGKIKIGRRKRVDHIEWIDYRSFSEKFDSEETTKEFEGRRYIHAWNDDKIVEYLRKAKMSIN